MSDAPKIETLKVPESKSPFWRFSIKFYQVPGVAPSCIELQDQAGVDVNVLFFLLWLATQNRALDKAQVAVIERSIGPWREMAVIPIRNVRRALKSPPPVMSAETAEGFRTRVKQVELEAERLQQEALFQMAERGPLGNATSSPLDAAKDSISAYQAVLRPFPAAPLETIFSAFAKFDAPR